MDLPKVGLFPCDQLRNLRRARAHCPSGSSQGPLAGILPKKSKPWQLSSLVDFLSECTSSNSTSIKNFCFVEISIWHTVHDYRENNFRLKSIVSIFRPLIGRIFNRGLGETNFLNFCLCSWQGCVSQAGVWGEAPRRRPMGVWGRSPQPLGWFWLILAKITPFGDHLNSSTNCFKNIWKYS